MAKELYMYQTTQPLFIPPPLTWHTQIPLPAWPIQRLPPSTWPTQMFPSTWHVGIGTGTGKYLQ